MATLETTDDPNQRPPVIGEAHDEGQGRASSRLPQHRRGQLSPASAPPRCVIPLVNQMNPSADVLALAAIEVDLSKIAAGSGIKVAWRKQPVFVRYLMPTEIAEAKAVPIATLRDPQTLDERTKPGHENWLITMAVCTHLGCVPLGITPTESRGQYGGYFCPCHGSQYDTAGRIRAGPAPKNLVVPDYSFKSATTVQIG